MGTVCRLPSNQLPIAQASASARGGVFRASNRVRTVVTASLPSRGLQATLFDEVGYVRSLCGSWDPSKESFGSVLIREIKLPRPEAYNQPVAWNYQHKEERLSLF